ncbi:PKD domain-containing protein [Arthrobacter sp. TWP1-1]|uniref:PKD domain-containing protein n=1 Tax=Arthrobacter sp. TWP1-1 TaxID=2804568 RepID=UPI003CEDE2DA
MGEPAVWTFHSGPHCVYDSKPRDILAEIAASIAHEFQRSPVVAASIGSQPGPHTLRGKETNVWAEATTQTFNLTMLGQKVTITATPVAYTWNYGDGTIWGPTPTHGAPLHKDRIGEQTQTSHIYTETGHLTINLTTHFNGSYTVNNGPQLPIPGQGNIPSPPLALTVWRAETNLYADNCFQNPQGIGC